MRLTDLHAEFSQAMPLATGIFTGLVYSCPNDPRRKRRHAVLFLPIIDPYTVTPSEDLLKYLDSNASWHAQPKWSRASGTTIETLTLTPSIAFPCCHINIENGEVRP